MSISKTGVILGALTFAAQVASHGILQGIVADGQWYPGYNPWVNQVTAAWKIAYDIPGGTWTGPVFSTQYLTPDIICGNGSTPGGSHIKVTAGSRMELQWSPWPLSHPGPVLTYLAACGTDCTIVDKATLKFNKIDEQGLLSPTTVPASPPFVWGANTLRDNNSTWVLTIPASIAPGKYVLRNEIIALHYAWDPSIGGAQNYPLCVNLDISGTGTDPLAGGTLGPSLYRNTDPGIAINVFGTLDHGYKNAGPPLYSPALPIVESSSNPSAKFSPSSSASASSKPITFAVSSTTSSSTLVRSTTAVRLFSVETSTSGTKIPTSSLVVVNSSAFSAAIKHAINGTIVPTYTASEKDISATSSTLSAASLTRTFSTRTGRPRKHKCPGAK